MRADIKPRRKNRRHVSTLDPCVYQVDRIGFLRGLRAIHRAAELGCDIRNSYLIVEYDRVVGIGGCVPHPLADAGSVEHPSSVLRVSGSPRDDRSGR
jgi:hypothetical protein